MRTIKMVFLTIFLLIILAGSGLFLAGYFAPKPGGIRVETTPKASVYLNGSLVGETPYTGSFKAEKISLRLIPEDTGLVPFETSITLTPGIETAVGRNFAAGEDGSTGYIVSFEKGKKDTAALVAMSTPGNAQVLIDGVSRGFSTYETTAIAPAMHEITVKSPGYQDFSMNVKTLVGYKMTFYAKLAKGDSQSTTGISPKTAVKTVTVLNTPTGFLRVRSEPGSRGTEIAQVKPGEVFPYLDTDIETGWIEIQYEASKSGLPSGIVGWISSDYASVSSELK